MKIGVAVLSGLAAGLWINLSGVTLVHFVLGNEYVETLMGHVPGQPGPGTLVRHLGIRFALGIVSVLLYAALRPRFERQAVAAVVAAAFLFFAGYVPLGAMLNEFGILVGWRLWATLLWGAGETIVAALLGSYLYERLGA